MKALVQKVKRAKVEVEGKTKGEIDRGFLVFLGVGKDDREKDAEYIASKIFKLRVFEDDAGKMNLDIGAVGGDILLVSQFTLYGDVKGQNRPSFMKAGLPDKAKKMYNRVGELIEKQGIKVEKGVFGAKMKVELINDGPVTIIIESKNE